MRISCDLGLLMISKHNNSMSSIVDANRASVDVDSRLELILVRIASFQSSFKANQFSTDQNYRFAKKLYDLYLGS